MILTDTDVLIDFLAGVEPIRRRIASYLIAGQMQTTVVTAFELLSGAREGKRGDAVRTLVQGLPVMPLERLASERAAAVRLQLERAGKPLAWPTASSLASRSRPVYLYLRATAAISKKWPG